jgi:hypothetical protein
MRILLSCFIGNTTQVTCESLMTYSPLFTIYHSNCPQCSSSLIVTTKQFVILFYNTSSICFFFLNKSMNSELIRLRQNINEKTADTTKFYEIFTYNTAKRQRIETIHHENKSVYFLVFYYYFFFLNNEFF